MFNNLKKYYINQLVFISLYSNLHAFWAFEQFIWNLRSIHSLLIKVDSLFHQKIISKGQINQNNSQMSNESFLKGN
jgi:hypothetical protein